MAAIPDLLARLLKCPVDLLHAKLCPCTHFNHIETIAELHASPGGSPDRVWRGGERDGLSADR